VRLHPLPPHPPPPFRSYFGEEAAFYFGFIAFYTRALLVPALMGLLSFIVNVVLSPSAYDSLVVPAFSAAMALWPIAVTELWKRRSKALAHVWWEGGGGG
jgi:hypothetical protein